jgi:hypothetical protein
VFPTAEAEMPPRSKTAPRTLRVSVVNIISQ